MQHRTFNLTCDMGKNEGQRHVTLLFKRLICDMGPPFNTPSVKHGEEHPGLTPVVVRVIYLGWDLLPIQSSPAESN